MSLIDRIKTTLFSDAKTKRAFVAVVRDKLPFKDAFNDNKFPSSGSNVKSFNDGDLDNALHTLLHGDERILQQTLAPFLRKATIAYMTVSQSGYMVAQREQFTILAIQPDASTWEYKTWDALLEGQSREYKYATNFEASALADLLDLKLLVTSSAAPNPKYFHLRREGEHAIFLINAGNHWYFEDGYSATYADGNCLYNAFARRLRQLVVSAENTAQNVSPSLDVASHIGVYKTQAEILADIQNCAEPTQAELIEMISAQLRPSEVPDHIMAVDLASDEYDALARKAFREESVVDDLPLTPPLPSTKSNPLMPSHPIENMASLNQDVLTTLDHAFVDFTCKISLLEQEKSSKYSAIQKTCAGLAEALTASYTVFKGTSKPTSKDLQAFREAVQTATLGFKAEAGKHRGFGNWPRIVRGILGILAVIAACIPAIIVQVTSSAGYFGTFFQAAEKVGTDSMKKLKALECALQPACP